MAGCLNVLPTGSALGNLQKQRQDRVEISGRKSEMPELGAPTLCTDDSPTCTHALLFQSGGSKHPGTNSSEARQCQLSAPPREEKKKIHTKGFTTCSSGQWFSLGSCEQVSGDISQRAGPALDSLGPKAESCIPSLTMRG